MLRKLSSAAALAVIGTATMAGPVAGHILSADGRIPMPLFVYVGGALAAVALSFAFAAVADPIAPSTTDTRRIRVPAVVRLGLRAIELLAWVWIAAQTVLGGSSDADVSSFFLWTYGWIGVALVSALAFPMWRWPGAGCPWHLACERRLPEQGPRDRTP